MGSLTASLSDRLDLERNGKTSDLILNLYGRVDFGNILFPLIWGELSGFCHALYHFVQEEVSEERL